MYYNFRYFEPNKSKIMDAFKQFAVITHQATKPRSLVVNKVNLETTKQALSALNLEIPVSSSGGCMRSELWLEA